MLPWQLHGNPQEVSSKFPNPKKCILNPKKWILSTNFSPKKLKFDTKKGVFQHQLVDAQKTAKHQVCTSRAPHPPPKHQNWPNVLSQPGAWQCINLNSADYKKPSQGYFFFLLCKCLWKVWQETNEIPTGGKQTLEMEKRGMEMFMTDEDENIYFGPDRGGGISQNLPA